MCTDGQITLHFLWQWLHHIILIQNTTIRVKSQNIKRTEEYTQLDHLAAYRVIYTHGDLTQGTGDRQQTFKTEGALNLVITWSQGHGEGEEGVPFP